MEIIRNFASDNCSGIHPDILQAIEDANAHHAKSYGKDYFTQIAFQKFKETFGDSVESFFVLNGTAANVLALAASTQSYHAIICAETSHLHMDECGAPEKFLGNKLLLIPTTNGKISVEQIKCSLQPEHAGNQHHVQPKIISIAQSTERGTVYTMEEIKNLAEFAHTRNLLLHVDGARISNAVASQKIKMKTIAESGVDILSFGGTKNGLMAGEAIIFFKPSLANGFPYVCKQGMQLCSKMRFISAQFIALLSNELWYKNAAHANEMAKKLADGLAKMPQIQITEKVETNAVFAIVPKNIIQKLQKKYHFYVWNQSISEVRLMTSFDTKEDDIIDFLTDIEIFLK